MQVIAIFAPKRELPANAPRQTMPLRGSAALLLRSLTRCPPDVYRQKSGHMGRFFSLARES
jgi:hypothetical protein